MYTSPEPRPTYRSHHRRTHAVAIPRQRSRPRPGRLAPVALAAAAALGLAVFSAGEVVAQDWQLQRVDVGTKPALSVAPDGTPSIIYMLERQDGWVRIAQLQDGEWQSEQVADGYFYGPPDIAVGPGGVVHAAYHDHQDSTFKPEKGDAVHVSGGPGAWTSTTAQDAGHDGWDNRITVDAEGQPHMVGMDPQDFGSVDGVEYYSLDEDGVWQAEQVGSGPQTYQWGISVAIDRAGDPWVTYYDGASSALMLAGRSADGWQVSTVDDTGDTGRFSEIAIDSGGGQHISYFESSGEGTGSVKYAHRESAQDEWQISTVDELSAVLLGFTGARNITSIDTDADGNPWIAYSDESILKLAHLVDGSWQTETVTEAGDVPLGQIVSLDIDAEGRPHIAFADVTDKDQLDGNIWYATRG